MTLSRRSFALTFATAASFGALIACGGACGGSSAPAASPVESSAAAGKVTPTGTAAAAAAAQVNGRCFILDSDDRNPTPVHVRAPAELCATRISPHSTFKIPHALFALDAGVVKGEDDLFPWDKVEREVPIWNRDHTLASAMRHSTIWYFQKLAERLGTERERTYLSRIGYGNADPSSNLTTFWLGGSLAISPDEQGRFLQRFYARELPFSREIIDKVHAMLVQPKGLLIRGGNQVPFGESAPADAVIEAKTGSGDEGKDRVRWMVGHVAYGGRGYRFVSAVRGPVDSVSSSAAVDLAASRLREEHVF